MFFRTVRVVCTYGCAAFDALWWGLPFGGTRGSAIRIVPRLMLCGGECLSAGREAPPYGLCRVCCRVVGVASRRDARPRPTVCASFGALRWVMPFGGTRGSAIRIVPRLMLCGGECLPAGREAVPYGLCLFCCRAVGVAFRRDARPRPTGLYRDNAVVLRHTFVPHLNLI